MWLLDRLAVAHEGGAVRKDGVVVDGVCFLQVPDLLAALEVVGGEVIVVGGERALSAPGRGA